MESSIAEFRMRQLACELLPTSTWVPNSFRGHHVRLVANVVMLAGELNSHLTGLPTRVPLVVITTRALARPVIQHQASQRSLQDAPIFRLLLKVAVKGTHQCDFLNF